MSLFKEKYHKKIAPELGKELGLKNQHLVPVLEKVVVNVGLGKMSQQSSFESKILPEIRQELAIITGQYPSLCVAKKSIAGFKLREGQVVGLKVTLRGKRMYDFIEKIVSIVLPRVRDFRGVDLKSVDEKGNLNLGFKEHVVFPEIQQDSTSVDFGVQIAAVTRAKKREHAVALYQKLGFLFKK